MHFLPEFITITNFLAPLGLLSSHKLPALNLLNGLSVVGVVSVMLTFSAVFIIRCVLAHYPGFRVVIQCYRNWDLRRQLGQDYQNAF